MNYLKHSIDFFEFDGLSTDLAVEGEVAVTDPSRVLDQPEVDAL